VISAGGRIISIEVLDASEMIPDLQEKGVVLENLIAS
jgi:hypothetical protein